MSAGLATSHSESSTAILARLHEFLAAQATIHPHIGRDEHAKVKDLGADLRRLEGSAMFRVAAGFGRVFTGFERISSIFARRAHPARRLPKLDKTASANARQLAFADDYMTFDRLSVLYGGLFRGSVIVNYLLGVVAVALTLASIIPQPQFVSSGGVALFPEFAWYAVRIEMACIVIIGAIYCYGQTPHHEHESREPWWNRPLALRRFAHRWHERWLEYRVLAERFRYLELMLSLSPDAALKPPFAVAIATGAEASWYDRYFVWRTHGASAAKLTVRGYREWALALMVEQIEHHDANSSRRGAIAARLHRYAVLLFFVSLLLCLVDLVAESSARSCQGSCTASGWCCLVGYFNDTLKSLVLFGAIFAPILAAAIHGILATTEYTKVAQSSRETAERIAALVHTIRTFPPSDQLAEPSTLEPIKATVAEFADAAINEASGWRAIFRDKNIPLA